MQEYYDLTVKVCTLSENLQIMSFSPYKFLTFFSSFCRQNILIEKKGRERDMYTHS